MPKRGTFEEKKREINEYIERGRLNDRDSYRDPRELQSDNGREYSDEQRDRRETPFDRNPSGRNKLSGNLLENIINSAANEAADVLSQKRPRFKKGFIANYLDKKALSEYAQKIMPYLQEGKISPEEAHEYLASHIISGDFLTEDGREIILSKSLEDKAEKWGGWHPGAKKAKNILKGEGYLDKAMEAFRDIYNLIQSDENYSKHMPELSNAVNALYELGFKDAALSALRKQLPENKYQALKLGISEATKQIVDYAGKTLESYFPQALAASILALVGIGVLVGTSAVTGNIITGNIIGTSNNSAISLPAFFFGAASLIFGIYLFMRRKPKRYR